ncbi:PREDICTED: nuclear transcription factor Y subunit A-2-like isoform X2 [Tarenaya hassleriana]|uniref:nuclear transcription factor Y subunit A-2-like isoform X2 n=1 Tax=Tarenaya hassleriana TaxID=28532 RepID=UPI00053CA90C|nr:PREDICTED: nuclear transcription factor Y subunit A-2-like isoform X2 [Tarenaya hassleriana]
MAMQTVYFKEREGILGNNPKGQILSPPQTTWWNVLGSQPLIRHGSTVGETEQGMDKLNAATQFTFSADDGQKPQGALTTQSACFEFGFAQPTILAKYPYVEQYYGVVSAYESQMPGRVMLPMNMATEDGPIYVNAKQYHGIIRRRQSRAKAVLYNKVTNKSRKQPYMHYSRHLHAMRRPRGTGGRFLNTKNPNKGERGGGSDEGKQPQPQPQPSNSQNSEVIHPENGTMNSSREVNGSNFSGSEVTSMDFFLGSGMVIPSKWIAAAAAMDNGCCNLKV